MTDEVPSIRIPTRMLEPDEIDELFDYLDAMPETVWTSTDIAVSKDRMMTFRQGVIVLQEHQKDEAMYAKLKWG